MAACVVSGTIKDPSETAISGATIRANIVTPNFNGGTTLLVTKEISTTSDANGAWSMTLAQGLSAVITIDYPPNTTDSTRRLAYAVIVPASATALFSTLVTEL